MLHRSQTRLFSVMPAKLLPGVLPWLVPCLVLAACASDTDEQQAGSAEAGDNENELREVSCIDQSFSQLGLFENPSPAGITEAQGPDGIFESAINATGGGLEATQSFVYARFTDAGLEKVELGDEDAFVSLDWHIAFRRYVIRLNSGISGPGEVTGARTRPNTEFEALMLPPDASEVPYRTEEYFTETCDYVNDGSGIGSPGTALASFWKYQGCVQMTGNVFVLALPGERHVKFQVLSYYSPDKQEVCDATGMVPAPSGAGNVRIRWAFID
jgi:hypothetical protein